MSLSLILASLWALIVNVMASFRRGEAAEKSGYALAAAGVPLVGYVTFQHGPWIGLLVLGAGVSLLRWPLVRIANWLRR